MSVFLDNLDRIARKQDDENRRAAAGATLLSLAEHGVDYVEDVQTYTDPLSSVIGDTGGILANYPVRRARIVCMVRGTRITIEEL